MLNIFRRGRSRKIQNGDHSGKLAFHISPDVKASTHAQGIILVHIGKGIVFSANRTGAAIWNGVVERWSLDRLAMSISDEFRISLQAAKQDAQEFLTQLAAEGLLVADTH